MKRILSILLLLSITLLIACGNGNTSDTPKDDASVTSSVPETESSIPSEDSAEPAESSGSSSEEPSNKPEKPENILYYEGEYGDGYDQYKNLTGIREILSVGDTEFSCDCRINPTHRGSLTYTIDHTEVPDDAYFLTALTFVSTDNNYTVQYILGLLKEKGLILERNYDLDIVAEEFGAYTGLIQAVGYVNVGLYQWLAVNEEFGTEIVWLWNPANFETDGVNADIAVWNEKWNFSQNDEIPEDITAFTEVYSDGLMDNVRENTNEDAMFCVLLSFESNDTLTQVFEEYSFVDDGEYLQQYLELIESDDGLEVKLGYASAELLLKLEELNIPMAYTWLPWEYSWIPNTGFLTHYFSVLLFPKL